MAKVKIQGHASGTGVLTVTAPNTSTDRTITLPDGTGTLIADDGSGKVGIGTTSPSQKLTISGGSVVIDDGEGYRFGNGDYRIEGKDDGANARIGFVTNNSEIARFTANGLTFNGDTASANALDDYEEGTWTPTTASGWSSLTLDGTGSYTKIGNIVHVMVQVHVNGSGTGSGHISIGGLPFTSVNTADYRSAISIFAYNLASSVNTYVSGHIEHNSTLIQMYEGGLTSSGSDMGAHFDTGSSFYLQVTYRV